LLLISVRYAGRERQKQKYAAPVPATAMYVMGAEALTGLVVCGTPPVFIVNERPETA